MCAKERTAEILPAKARMQGQGGCISRQHGRDTRYEVVEAESIRPGPIRHATLPPQFNVRARLVHAVLGDASGLGLADFLEAFRRDAVPESELSIWERVAMMVAEINAAHSLTAAECASLVTLMVQASSLGTLATDQFPAATGLRAEVAEAAARTVREHTIGTDRVRSTMERTYISRTDRTCARLDFARRAAHRRPCRCGSRACLGTGSSSTRRAPTAQERLTSYGCENRTKCGESFSGSANSIVSNSMTEKD